MSGRIPQHFIDELIARADIVELIGARVQLRKAGREYKACCPFHDEKTPSFTVSPDKQFYHCFGCGAHGTALGFLMAYDHLPFVEAVEELAARLGLEVPREQDPHQRPRPADDLYALLERVADFYRKELMTSERARDYLRQRGLGGDTVQRFGLGYAPDGWDAVLRRFGATEAEERRLLAVGLAIERERRTGGRQGGGSYDRFRDRIMFPIRDARGRTIGFGGRVLDRGEPKYMNSPETELFHKGRELYGLYEARQATRNLSRLLVVEGYMDVVRLHQAGVTYAVATLGTATTPDHLTRLFRVSNEIVFCFDGDRAGRAAAWRALENALAQTRQGRQMRFLFLPEGHDPDSLIGEEGREAFERRLLDAVPLASYFISELSARFDLASVDGRAQLAEAARPLVNRVPPGVYRELLLDELAKVVRMEPERLAALLATELPGQAAGVAARNPPAVPLAGASARTSGGRRNLVRQAIHLLVHHPSAASAVTEPQELRAIDRPGIPLLIQLLETYRGEETATTGQLLERFRDQPDHAALEKLAMVECLVPDVQGAAAELRQAVERLVREFEPARRTDELLAKARSEALTDEEKLELQRLLQSRTQSPPPGTGPRT